MGIAKEGIAKIFILLVAALLFALSSLKIIASFLFLIALFLIYFYRDLQRIPDREKGVVSPADGIILEVEDVFDGDFFAETCKKISIFMRIYDVHVNRMPLSGRIIKITNRGEKLYPANDRRASELNKSRTYFIELEDGKKMVLRQIAGIIARQIVSYVKEHNFVRRGERIGIVQFGSRVELYIDRNLKTFVSVGDKVFAGKTILGE
ncbi:MAG: phosphatidylserine decarboxylase [Candidatus Hydrogenedentota bacterium]